MIHSNLSKTKKLVRLCCVFLFGLFFAAGVRGQTNEPQAAKPAATNDDYVIGAGDVLSISVTYAPEYSGKFLVDQSGYLTMPSLPSTIKAAGQTPAELCLSLAKALEDANLYRNPTVNAFVDEYHSRQVSVVGAVGRPGVYPLRRRTTVVEVVSEAGLLPTAGNRVTIIPAGLTESGQPAGGAAQTFDLAKLMRGEDPKANVEVHDGDVVRVSTADVVYVVGAVVKPGGFVMQDQSAGVSALQAVALAEGLKSVASTRRVVIVRRNADGTARERVPVDLSKIMAGKTGDVLLVANDILFIPVSGSKQSLLVMGNVAMTAVNGAAFYGVGYRVGGY